MYDPRVRTAAAALLLVLLAGTAHAGRSRFGWLYDTETVPERGVELEQWLWDQRRQGPDHTNETNIWWAPVIGVTDQLELALPIVWGWSKGDVANAKTALLYYGAEARYRLVSSDPVEAPAWVPLIRVGVKKPVYESEAAQLEADAVITYDQDRVHATLDLGVVDDVHNGPDVMQTHSGAGVTIGVTDELGVGVEAYGEFHLSSGASENEDWMVVGPDLSWTHGRFWLSASYGIGVYQISSAPRMKWGIAF